MIAPELQQELDVVLRRGDVMLAALDEEAFRTTWPPALAAAPERLVPLPTTRSTLLDLIVPEDAYIVIEAWEAVLARTRSITSVRLREAPHHRVWLIHLDLRPSTGVVVAAFLPDAAEANAAHAAQLPAEALTTSQRARSGVLVKSLLGELLHADDRLLMMTGWHLEEIVGKRSTDLIHPEDRERALRAYLEMRSSGRPCRARVRHQQADGSWLWVELENRPDISPDGQARVICDVIDVSEELAAHEAVRQSARLFRLLAEAMPVGVVRLEADGRTGFANARAAQALGLTVDAGQDASAVLPDSLALFECIKASHRDDAVTVMQAALRGLAEGVPSAFEVAVISVESLERWCRIEVTVIADTEGSPGALLCVSDTTARHLAEQDLQHRASTDALTGCANRAALMSAVQAALDAHRAGGGEVGLLFADLDGFKSVNDTLGHRAGDELLCEVASRLRTLVRGHDVVGRLGGDEFVILTIGCDQEVLEKVRARLSAGLSGLVTTSAGPARLGASIGSVLATAFDDAASLLGRADEAMYADKHHRRLIAGDDPRAGALPSECAKIS